MLKIKDNVDLKELEKFGFKYNDNYHIHYEYNFLIIEVNTRKIFIGSGVDEVNGDEEIIKLYDLIKADLVEKV